jgi:hypothetical protein
MMLVILRDSRPQEGIVEKVQQDFGIQSSKEAAYLGTWYAIPLLLAVCALSCCQHGPTFCLYICGEKATRCSLQP